MSIRIALARPEDLDALLALEEAAFPGDRMSRRALARNIGSPSLCFLVARDGKRLIGWCRGRRSGRPPAFGIQAISGTNFPNAPACH